MLYKFAADNGDVVTRLCFICFITYLYATCLCVVRVKHDKCTLLIVDNVPNTIAANDESVVILLYPVSANEGYYSHHRFKIEVTEASAHRNDSENSPVLNISPGTLDPFLFS